MELKLGKIASVLTLIAAWAYSLGWIKTFYYYNTFGIGTESLDLTPQDYLFASWYTVETLVFFVLLFWVVAVSRRLWPWLFVLAYLPMPFFGEWSYGHLYGHWYSAICRYLVENPHTILKFFPFIVLILVMLIDKNTLPLFRDSSWPYGNFALAVLLIVAIAWSISATKHIGGSEAKRALRDPDGYLLHVKLHFSDTATDVKSIESQQRLYMLYFSPHRCIVLDFAGDDTVRENSNSQPSSDLDDIPRKIKVFDIPRESVRLVEGTRTIPGAGVLLWRGEVQPR